MTVEPPTDKQDDSQDQERRTLKNKPVDAIFAVSRNKEMPTLAADFGKVFIETSNHSCTFLFFRQHPLIKYADVGKEMALEGIEEELFLEVKMTMETAFAISVFMEEVLKHVRANPEKHLAYFGPTAIKQETVEKK